MAAGISPARFLCDLWSFPGVSSPFLDFHYWLVFKQLQFPKIGLDLGQWEESGLAIKADIYGGAVAQV